jgi:uncharacterized membrane protein YedE/YeeE
MFESPEKLFLGLLTGLAFGFLLHKGRVTRYEVILGQLLLRDWTVLKIMLTAVVVGAAGVYALVAAGAASLDIWPFQVSGVLIGAVAFGIGLAVFGYCPGTGVAASGAGRRDAMVGVAGMAAGALVFVAAFPVLDPVINAVGDLGQVTIPHALGVPPAVVIAGLAASGGLVLWLVERWSRPTAAKARTDRPRRAA